MELSIANKIKNHPNRMLTCPYDKAHQVEQYRMHVHLSKCRKQYPDSAKSSCPFNNAHVVADAEMDYHVMRCEDRLLLDQQLFQIEGSEEYRHRATAPSVGSSGEDWDEMPYEPYQPEEKFAHVIRKVKGATPAERRKARMEGVKHYKGP